MIRLANGHIVDPATERDGAGDLWIEAGRIVDPPPGGKADETIDLAGGIVMAGAIDIHSHIAGGNVNTARLLLSEQHKAHAPRPDATPLANAGWSTFQTGCLYAQMGFTTVVEPAMLPSHALHAHLELADIPIIDTATLCVLGNDDYLLRRLHERAGAAAVADYVAYMLDATRALGVKVINAGAAAAFKANVRAFSLDDVVPDYGVSSRAIMSALQQGVIDVGVPHPLHVHCNNLGQPGNVDTAIATIDAAEGRPLHLAHVQFYGYGRDGRRGFSSAAARLAAHVNANPHVTVDVGQVMFGQTVTISCDITRQFAARGQARPRKYVIWDGEASGGGIVPYKYQSGNFHNAVQWATGLELFLLIDDPFRVFFTTDHPNGAPFTTYPEIFALLMDRQTRAEWISHLPKSAMEMTTLASIAREYTLGEIATMTRVAPARLLGLADRGHLGAGAKADIAVYRRGKDIAAMFRLAERVFKDGVEVVRHGKVLGYTSGRTLRLTPDTDAATRRRMQAYYNAAYGVPAELFEVRENALPAHHRFGRVACAST